MISFANYVKGLTELESKYEKFFKEELPRLLLEKRNIIVYEPERNYNEEA